MAKKMNLIADDNAGRQWGSQVRSQPVIRSLWCRAAWIRFFPGFWETQLRLRASVPMLRHAQPPCSDFYERKVAEETSTRSSAGQQVVLLIDLVISSFAYAWRWANITSWIKFSLLFCPHEGHLFYTLIWLCYHIQFGDKYQSTSLKPTPRDLSLTSRLKASSSLH